MTTTMTNSRLDECCLCDERRRNTDLLDDDSGKAAHSWCFFAQQKWLECGNNYTSMIRNNPINKKWYIYNNDNKYKHSEKPISFCPFCGVVLTEHPD